MPRHPPLKKGELATRAQTLVANTGWLPKPLRLRAKAAA
jgi:hypothetical protein